MMQANFTGAILIGTDLRGADLRSAIGLKAEQIEQAIIDKNTRLPDYLKRPQPERVKLFETEGN